jgi:hypothetical protein
MSRIIRPSRLRRFCDTFDIVHGEALGSIVFVAPSENLMEASLKSLHIEQS